VIAVHSLSKAYGLAGARVGFVHGSEEAMHMLRSVQTFSTYCAAVPMQLASAVALRDGAEWLADARARYEEAADMACSALGVPKPGGGTFLFLDISAHLREGEDTLGFLDRCLDRRVLLTPGGSFGEHFPSWVRLCFTSVPPEELEAALERITPLFGG
jgi:N-succinyldiaminopimelate aminotransferase